MVIGLTGEGPAAVEVYDRASSKIRSTPATIQGPLSSSLSFSSASLYSKYAQSDIAASLSKVSTNLSASAMSTLASGPGIVRTTVSNVATSTSLSSVAGRLWRSQKASKEADGSESDEPDSYTSLPSTPAAKSRNRKPPKFVWPKDTVRYVSNHQPAIIISRRKRSDSAASGASISSLQERLSALTNSLARPSPLQPERSVPRPLLLSGSARRASGSSQLRPVHYRRGSSTMSTSPGSYAAPNGTLSPPAGVSTENDSPGLYRIGSRPNLARNTRSPELGDSAETWRTLDYGEVDQP